MADLTPHLGNALNEHHNYPRPVPQELRGAVDRELSLGIIGAARLDARSHVAQRAMANMHLLSADWAAYTHLTPHGHDLYRAIAVAYAQYAVFELESP